MNDQVASAILVAGLLNSWGLLWVGFAIFKVFRALSSKER
jgi:hypothetical protein